MDDDDEDLDRARADRAQEEALRQFQNSMKFLQMKPKSKEDDTIIIKLFPNEPNQGCYTASSVVASDLKRLEKHTEHPAKSYINDRLLSFAVLHMITRISDNHKKFISLLEPSFYQLILAGYSVDNCLNKIRERSLVLVPVEFQFHWTLVILANFNGSVKGSSPLLLYMNPFGSNKKDEIPNVIARYLAEKLDIKDIQIKAVQGDKQENYYDCGIYVICYIRWILSICASGDGDTNVTCLYNHELIHNETITPLIERSNIKKQVEDTVSAGKHQNHLANDDDDDDHDDVIIMDNDNNNSPMDDDSSDDIKTNKRKRKKENVVKPISDPLHKIILAISECLKLQATKETLTTKFEAIVDKEKACSVKLSKAKDEVHKLQKELENQFPRQDWYKLLVLVYIRSSFPELLYAHDDQDSTITLVPNHAVFCQKYSSEHVNDVTDVDVTHVDVDVDSIKFPKDVFSIPNMNYRIQALKMKDNDFFGKYKKALKRGIRNFLIKSSTSNDEDDGVVDVVVDGVNATEHDDSVVIDTAAADVVNGVKSSVAISKTGSLYNSKYNTARKRSATKSSATKLSATKSTNISTKVSSKKTPEDSATLTELKDILQKHQRYMNQYKQVVYNLIRRFTYGNDAIANNRSLRPSLNLLVYNLDVEQLLTATAHIEGPPVTHIIMNIGITDVVVELLLTVSTLPLLSSKNRYSSVRSIMMLAPSFCSSREMTNAFARVAEQFLNAGRESASWKVSLYHLIILSSLLIITLSSYHNYQYLIGVFSS